MDYNKKYESVMDRLQCLIANAKKQGHIIIRIEDIENAITELQESEDDKIRDEICTYIGAKQDISLDMHNRWISWLEKQGEKKHKFIIGDIISNNNVTYRVDNIVKNCIGQDCYFLVNVEREKDGTRYLKIIDSKGKSHNSGEITWICEQVDAKFEKKCEQNPIKSFKVGDWVVNKFGDSWHIDSFDKKNYQVSDGKGNYSYFPIAKQDEMHLWTIEDAKDGDVLVHNDCTFIFMGIKDGIVQAIEGNILEPVSFGEPDKDNDYHPATKEQRDLFFTKIIVHPANYLSIIRSTKPNDENTASIWSDVDEYMLNETTQHLEILIRMEKNGVDCDSQYYQRDIDWLKTIKERIASM